MKKDEFTFDVEESSEENFEVRDRTIPGMSRPLGEMDVPSIFLTGTVAGATSRDKSEDPNFSVIRDMTEGPEGVILTDQERYDCQSASIKRHRTDPQYGGILDTYHSFTIGTGVNISPVDESKEVAEYLNDFIFHNQFDGLDSDLILRTIETGEIFVRFFFKSTTLPARVPRITLLNFWEISKIEYDSVDKSKSTFYHRPYRDEGDTEIKIEKIPADEIIHIKFGPGYDKRGLPPFLKIIQQCQYYLDWLFARIVLNRLKSSYYLEEITKGSPASVTTQDNVTPDAIAYTGKQGKAQKRLPKIGSKLVHNESVEYKWLRPDVGADDAREDGRSIRLSICSGAQVPEFVLGDASNANYSSALVSQNPFIRKVEFLRDFFERYFKQIFEKVIAYGIQNRFLPSTSTETLTKEKAVNVGLIRRLKKLFKFNEQYDTAGNIVVINSIPTQTDIEIKWPILIAQRLLEDSQAYQIHQAMGVASDETLSYKLGYNPEEEAPKLERQRLNAQADAQDQPGGPDPNAHKDAQAEEPMPELPAQKP